MSEFVTRKLVSPDGKQTKEVKLRTLAQAGAEEFREPPKKPEPKTAPGGPGAG